ncbi:MAG: T9SS type A sorting domain-containing protein [Bacteroidales bacterium]|jgi:hypothetical protein
MKKMNLLWASFVVLIISIPSPTTAQTTSWVKQVISVNGGKFETSPPYSDFVTLQAYNPLNQSVNVFNTIFTQSVQDILIQGQFAYVAAQDSLIKYNLNTFERVAAIADSGLSKLGIYHNRLIVSKQSPVNTYFVEILDTANLSLVSRIEKITGDCSGIASIDDSVYIAVNGGWMGTEGKIGVIDPSSWTLVREIDLGADAIGINNLYIDGGKLYSVNTTPYGSTTGSISLYDPATGTYINHLIDVTVGYGIGVKNHVLYSIFNNGIGSFSLSSMTIIDTTIVKDPGATLFKYILSSVLDTVNNLFYVNIGDYITNGYCLITSLNGDSLNSYATGISTQAVGIDYRIYPAGIKENKTLTSLTIFPNPVVDQLTIQYSGEQDVSGMIIKDIYGKPVKSFNTNLKRNETVTISVEDLSSAVYCLVLKTNGYSVITKFIKP